MRREGGDENAARVLAGWRAEGWPGFLTPENERILRWATVAEAMSADAADARYGFEAEEGDEELLVVRQTAALGFVRARAAERTRKRLEEAANHGG